jgi:hypothetical protein
MIDDADTATPSIEAASAFQFLRENCTVISGLAVVSGITLAIIFLFSYLSVFDWHLIEFIQYVDVITLGVIAVGVASGSLILITNAVDAWVNLRALESKKSRRRTLITIGCITATVIGFSIWGEVRAQNGYLHVIAGAAVLAMTILLAVRVLNHIRARERLNAAQIANYAIVVLILTALTGQWLAYSVL